MPYVHLDGKQTLFISNAAARYLFSSTPEIAHAKVEEWLEWEAVVFTPALSHYGSGVKSENVKNVIQTSLKKLDAFLANKSFLVDVSMLLLNFQYRNSNYILIQEHVTVADVAIWSVLYPLYGDNTFKECLSPYTNVAKWFKKLESLDEFKVVMLQLENVCLLFFVFILECYISIQGGWCRIVQCFT